MWKTSQHLCKFEAECISRVLFHGLSCTSSKRKILETARVLILHFYEQSKHVHFCLVSTVWQFVIEGLRCRKSHETLPNVYLSADHSTFIWISAWGFSYFSLLFSKQPWDEICLVLNCMKFSVCVHSLDCHWLFLYVWWWLGGCRVMRMRNSPWGGRWLRVRSISCLWCIRKKETWYTPQQTRWRLICLLQQMVKSNR